METSGEKHPNSGQPGPQEPRSLQRKSDVIITFGHETNDNVEKYQPSRLSSNITIISCYLANFSDGFQNTIANPTNVILGKLLRSNYTKGMKTRISNSVLVGIIFGTMVLGYTSDMYSRKAGLLLTSCLVVIGTLMSTLALQVHSTHNMLWFLIVSRGIAGFGVGGEYPASAAAGLEESDDLMQRYRGPMFVSFTTLMATTGGPVCIFIYLMALIASNNNVTVAYHAIYSIATLLPLIIVILRIFMSDSKLFHNSNLKQTKRPLRVYLTLCRRYWRRMLTTSLAFFLYDFINFPNSIMSSSLLASLVPNSSSHLQTTAVWQLILTLIVVPGPILGAYLANTRLLGRRYTGMLGFLGYVVLGVVIGVTYPYLSKNIPAFVVCYGLLQFFGHMGPGSTIGLISSESFPTAMRSFGYSIAAAWGKTGATIGTECFTPLQDAAGDSSTFYLLAGVAALGMVVYWFLPEGRDLDLEKEDMELKAWLGEKAVAME